MLLRERQLTKHWSNLASHLRVAPGIIDDIKKRSTESVVPVSVEEECYMMLCQWRDTVPGADLSSLQKCLREMNSKSADGLTLSYSADT